MNLKKTAVTIVIAGVLTVGVVGAANAQQNTFGDTDRGDRGLERLVGRGGLMALYEAIIDETDLSGIEIWQQARDGGTLAEAISDSGGDVEVVLESAIANATERVNIAVENGRLTQEEADELLAAAEQRFTEILNTDFVQGAVERMVGQGIIRFAAEQTGLNPHEIRDGLEGGASLAEILTANGVNVDTFTSDVLARVEARLNVRVVDGRMTQERADEILSNLAATVAERINQPGLSEVEPAGS
jgi:hypothetical protein